MLRGIWKRFMKLGVTGLPPMTTTRQLPLTLKQKNLLLNERKSDPLDKLNDSYKETDPNGRNPHELGAKLDAGKVCVWLGALGYFPRAIEQVAAVSTFGAKKYAWKGWETVPDGINRYSDALGRHLIEEGIGHVYDKDSGLLVAAHTAWNALARLELMLREKEQETNV